MRSILRFTLLLIILLSASACKHLNLPSKRIDRRMEMWRKAQLVLTQTHKVIHSAAMYHLLYIGNSFTAVGCSDPALRSAGYMVRLFFFFIYSEKSQNYVFSLIIHSRKNGSSIS